VNDYKVIVTPLAKNDLTKIISYLKDFGIGIAKRYYDGIMKKLRTLGIMPNTNPLVRIEKYRKIGMHWTNFKNI